MIEQSDQTTAVHEAGHAVLARILRLKCGHVTIIPEPDQGIAGYAITADPYAIMAAWDEGGRWRDYDTAMRARVLVCMAGAIAEEEFFADSTGGDTDDRQQISWMLDSFLPPDADIVAIERRLRRWAAFLVRRHRAKIRVVADALLRERTISAAVCDALVSPAA